jgi:hypothetical protein
VRLITANTIALVLLGGLLLTLAYYMTNRQRATLRELNWRAENLEERREVLASSFKEIGTGTRQPYSSNTTSESPGKFIPSLESPDLSFAYSDRLARHLSPGLDYRFETGPENRKGPLKENRYTLAGEASFGDIYQFVHALESGRAYYRIRRLHMKPTWDPFAATTPTSVREKEIAFTLDLADLPKLSTESTLVAISGKIAYMRDAGGKLVALREGDRVFEGRVIRVDNEEGYVEIEPIGQAERLMFRVGHTGMWGTR